MEIRINLRSNMDHKLVLTRQTDEFVEWECPDCDKHVRVAFTGGLKVLNPGDQSVKHSATLAVAGLGMNLDGDLAEGSDSPKGPVVH